MTQHQEQFGVQCLAQGHFHVQIAGAGDWTSNPLISGHSRPLVLHSSVRWKSSFVVHHFRHISPKVDLTFYLYP